MDDQLHSADYTYRLSQQWNTRDKKFDFLKNPLTTSLLEKEIESIIPDAPLTIEKAKVLIPEMTEEMALIALNAEVEKEGMTNFAIQDVIKSIQESKEDRPPLRDESIRGNNALQDTLINSGFHAWLHSLASKSNEKSSSQLPKANTVKKDKLEKIKPDQREETALTPVSETLAKLLASQGYREEAIMMYEKLSLKFPEKKDIFAGLILKLKI